MLEWDYQLNNKGYFSMFIISFQFCMLYIIVKKNKKFLKRIEIEHAKKNRGCIIYVFFQTLLYNIYIYILGETYTVKTQPTFVAMKPSEPGEKGRKRKINSPSPDEIKSRKKQANEVGANRRKKRSKDQDQDLTKGKPFFDYFIMITQSVKY